MTITEAAAQLLTHFSEEEREIPDNATYPGRNAAVKLAMNMALQELFGEASPWVRFDERGHTVEAPTAVTISVTNGSTAGSVTGWASWMAGCTIVIEGHDIDNQVRDADSTVQLKYPYEGTTGSKAATVYHDCITLGDDVMEVVKPVRFDRQLMSPSPAIEGGLFRSGDRDYGFHRHITPGLETPRAANSLGDPVRYAIETWTPDATTAPKTRMKLDPISGQGGTLDYRAKLTPPAITDTESTDTLPIAFQFIESVFFPVARKHLSGSTFWRYGADPNEIERAYRNAKQLLSALMPRKDSGRMLRPLY